VASDPDATARWAERRRELLDDTIDVTAYELAVVREVADG
jgi:hypothetical protein